jgi:superkiller protein 3
MIRQLLYVLILALAPWRCWPQTSSVEEQARRQIEQGNLEQAEATLRPYLKLHDGNALACYLLGVALSGQGKRDESDRYLKKALQLDQNLTLATRFLGFNAFEAGDHASASKYMRGFLQKSPRDEVAHLTLAQIELARKEFTRALRHFRTSKGLLRQDPHLQVLYGQALAGANQSEEAARTALSIQSEDPVILFETGLLLAQTKQYKQAIEKFMKARPNYPEPAALEYNLALTYFEMGDSASAISVLNGMIAEKHGAADVYSLLGDAYVRQGDIRKAESALQMAVELDPAKIQYFVDLLALYVDTEAADAGLDVVGRALQRFPSNYELYALRAVFHSLRSETGEAQADYRRALELSPGTEWLYTSLATLLSFDDDRLEAAKTLLESHLDQFKGYYAYFLYSEVLRRMGLDRLGPFQEKALSLLEKSVRLNPDFGPARLNLGRLYATRRDWPNAILHFRAAIKSDPGDKRPYYELYKIYRRDGNEQKAGEMLALVEKLNSEEGGKTPRANVRERLEALKRAALSGRK